MDSHLFSGLKVIDLATVIAAPAAAMMLADFGADVIKIEQPGEGDMLRIIRDLGETNEGAEDYLWQMDCRNKRGLALDLKSAEGMEILHKLIAECDVLITNHPYSVRDSLGLNYEELKPLNPTMIYASLTAYGEKGPERDRKGFDQLAYWARSGLMDLMRDTNTTPTQGLPGMGDHPTGVALYAAIVTALLQRERTGEGGMVHTSLLANGLWSCAGIAQGVMAGGNTEAYREIRRTPLTMLKVFQCSDERYLQLNMVRNTDLYSLLCAALDAMHLLTDERFMSEELFWENRAQLTEAIAAIISTRSSDAWLKIFADFNVPVNLVAIVEEIPTDVQVLENEMTVVPGDPEFGIPQMINHPIKISNVAPVEPKNAPGFGEHSEDILRELGYDEMMIAEFRARGIIEVGGLETGG